MDGRDDIRHIRGSRDRGWAFFFVIIRVADLDERIIGHVSVKVLDQGPLRRVRNPPRGLGAGLCSRGKYGSSGGMVGDSEATMQTLFAAYYTANGGVSRY
ncbi:hypothetical protein ETB97_001614 [Aspergillus alliaceus]|uniref:Uncharacterized protein n=1 Tax=Petromyces alliaceus TaxID=209559 RepID=A0A8H6A3Z0_PETAA|nr:hypothetical protein ETB97_001614 [Aspergillus burnettii]